MARHASVGFAEEDGAFKRVPMPSFHTSASHKLYQYWPRLRINLSLDGFDPLQFQRQCDEADHSLEQNLADAADATVRPHIIVEYVQRLYHQTNLVPQTIIFLLQMTPTYSLQNAMSQIPMRKPDDGGGYLKLSELSMTLLLLLSVAFHYLSPDPSSDYGTTASSWKCFQLALTRLWTVHSQAEDFMLNTKLMVAVQLQIMYGRPFHAIGILRQVGLSLTSTWTRSRLSLGPASFIAKMHFLMESDLLSEIDGQPTADTSQLFFDTSGNVNGSQMQIPLYAAAPEQQVPLFLDQTLWLRLCQNRILTTIYMINNSYSNPRFVGRPISDFTSELEFWYRSLPIELQFPRTIAAYGLLTQIIPSYKVGRMEFSAGFVLTRAYTFIGQPRNQILLLPLHVKPPSLLLPPTQRDRALRHPAEDPRRLPPRPIRSRDLGLRKQPKLPAQRPPHRRLPALTPAADRLVPIAVPHRLLRRRLADAAPATHGFRRQRGCRLHPRLDRNAARAGQSADHPEQVDYRHVEERQAESERC
jgi:hypothetical protein